MLEPKKITGRSDWAVLVWRGCSQYLTLVVSISSIFNSLNQIHEMNRNFALSTSSALSHVWQPLCGNSMWGCTGWAWWNSVELSVGLECGIPESPLVWWFWCWIYMPSSLNPISKNHEIQLCRLFDSPFKLVFCRSSRAWKLEDASKQAPPALAAPIFCALASSFERFDAIEISL